MDSETSLLFTTLCLLCGICIPGAGAQLGYSSRERALKTRGICVQECSKQELTSATGAVEPPWVDTSCGGSVESGALSLELFLV